MPNFERFLRMCGLWVRPHRNLPLARIARQLATRAGTAAMGGKRAVREHGINGSRGFKGRAASQHSCTAQAVPLVLAHEAGVADCVDGHGRGEFSGLDPRDEGFRRACYFAPARGRIRPHRFSTWTNPTGTELLSETEMFLGEERARLRGLEEAHPRFILKCPAVGLNNVLNCNSLDAL